MLFGSDQFMLLHRGFELRDWDQRFDACPKEVQDSGGDK